MRNKPKMIMLHRKTGRKVHLYEDGAAFVKERDGSAVMGISFRSYSDAYWYYSDQGYRRYQ